ncbi:hypothetical protein [Roseospirillum parvum]|uniref:Uncharacterized protein n=1 Tax=Roseospirillum parvum TaxID=83401 RepID=A0A1G8G0V3_9PROT|nr:hypothetical protein [Roseospirillum parvum]SDH88039.1 hypothetical protein SAMN05421742_1187 [Roseospirillum parvum]
MSNWPQPGVTLALGVEVATGDTYEGSPVYCKALDVGAGPNNGNKNVDHGIEGLNTFVDMRGCFVNPSTGDVFPIPFSHPWNLGNAVYLGYIGGQIRVASQGNYSDKQFVVFLFYTKTA